MNNEPLQPGEVCLIAESNQRSFKTFNELMAFLNATGAGEFNASFTIDAGVIRSITVNLSGALER